MDRVPRKVQLVAHVRGQGGEKEGNPNQVLNSSHYYTFKSIGHISHFVTESFTVFAAQI
jgi:hypothetical protein